MKRLNDVQDTACCVLYDDDDPLYEAEMIRVRTDQGGVNFSVLTFTC